MITTATRRSLPALLRFLPCLCILLIFIPIFQATFAADPAKTSISKRSVAQANPAPSSVTLTSVTASTYPNESVTLNATVSGNGAVPAPTGRVNFVVGTTLLGTANVTPIDPSDSTATFTVNGSQLAIGSNAITAIYLGDANYSGATSPATTVTLNSSQVNFGPVAVSTTSAVQTLTYQFNVGATLSAVNILTSGMPGLDYADGGSSTCIVGSIYPAGGSCVVSVAFTPSAPGQRPGGVTLFAQGVTTPLMTWYLSGIGQSSAVTIDPGTQSTIATISGGMPFGSAVDGAGNVYVVDQANSQVFELAAGSFTQTTVVASGLSNPTAVALDCAGNLYISDTGSGWVLMVPEEQGSLNSADMSIVAVTGLVSPRGLAVDGSGNLYVADSANNNVVEFSLATGTTSPVASTLTSPSGVAVDASGNVYVAAGNSVTEYQPPFAGTPIPIGAGYNNPSGLAVDAAGTVFVADTGNARIVEVAAGGASQATFAITGIVAPQSVSLDSADNLYVTDGANVFEVNRTQAAGLVFPNTDVGSTSAAQTLTVSNAGNQQLAISNLAITANFTQVPSGGTDCTSSSTLPSGAQCLIAVVFAPTVSGTLTGAVALTDNALNNPASIQSVALLGAGNASPTTTTVSASPNPSFYGQATTLSAVVSPAGSGTPTGSVTFTDGANTLGTFTLSAGAAQLTTASLNAGSHSITASYSGDSNFSASSSTAFSLVVNRATSSLALGSTGNVVYMQPVTFTATITQLYGGIASGTVTFQDGAAAMGSTSVAGNSAAFTTSMLAVGSHSITATYSGDNNVAGSSSSALVEMVSKATTAVTANSSVNPSAPGQPVTFSVVVSPQFAGAPTGTVVLKKSSVAIATLALSGGQASFTTSSLALGTSLISAVYAGDSNFAGGTSAILKQVVSKLATTIRVTASANPGSLGQPVTFTATVSSANGAPPDGEIVTFKNAGTILATAGLSAGAAAFTTASLPAGSLAITAIYSGDATFSTGTSAAFEEMVNKYPTTSSVISDGSPSSFGQSVTFTATVASASGGTPAGTVTFKNGSAALGTQTLTAGGASFATSALALGPHNILVTYNGDANNAASTSSAVSQIVTKAAPNTLTLSPASYNFGLIQATSPITFVSTSFAITNNGAMADSIASTRITGPEGQDDGKFIVNNCKVIAAGASCFPALQVGPDIDDAVICQPCNDILWITFTDGTVLQFPYSWTVINLAVNGTVLPASMIFTGSTGVPTADQVITITNTQTCPGCQGLVTVGQITMPPNFFVDSDPCSNTAIAPGQTCQVSLYAVPSKIGTYAGVVTVPSNLPSNKRRTIAVSARGTP